MEFLITNIIITVFIYLSIATTLVLIDGKSREMETNNEDLKFDELVIDYSVMPLLSSYECRDESKLNYRHYPAKSDNVLILLHGSGWHSQYFYLLSKYLSSENIINVYTPDLRGHGLDPDKRGDIKYINQFEDDIADLIIMIRQQHPNSKIILGGHSSGGGLAIRYAGSKYSDQVDGYLLLTPFLKYNAPTMRSKSGGWAFAHMQRIAGLSMLNNIGIKWFNHLPVIDFNMPLEYRDGSETLTYSFRLNTGYAPRNYKKDLAKMKQKALVVIGADDESFVAEKFLSEMSQYKDDIEVVEIHGLTHMGIVMGEEIRDIIKTWLDKV
jgi:non-heme chloroperoxidase